MEIAQEIKDALLNEAQTAANLARAKSLWHGKRGQEAITPKTHTDTAKNGRFLYFIGSENLVKIGSSVNPQNRIKELEIGNPQKMYLIAAFANMGNIESEMHKKFDHLRVRGEWFRYTDEIHAIIRELSL